MISAPLSLLGGLTAHRVVRTVAAVVAVLAIGIACGAITVLGAYWLGFALLLGLSFTAVTLQRPLVGVIGAIAVLYLLPFGVIPFNLGPVRLTFLDASLTITLTAWLLATAVSHTRRVVFSPVGVLVLLFLGLALVAFLFGANSVSGETFRFFLKTINAVLFFFTVINVIRTPTDLRTAAQALLLAAGAGAAVALALYFLPSAVSHRTLAELGRLGYPAGDEVLRYIADTQVLRATGTAVDPNVLGGMLLLALPLALSQLFEARPLIPRPLAAVVLLTLLSALLLTYSRGSWLGAGVGMAFVAAFRHRRIALWAGGAAAGLLFVPQASTFVERFRSGVLFEDRAAQMRLGEYKDALRLISEYPLFGVGFGVSPRLDLYVATSSIYLLMAEEMGLVGLAMFLLTMALCFRTLFVHWQAILASPSAGITLGAAGGVLGALSAGLFDHYFFNLQFPHTVALFWLFVGLVIVGTQLATGEQESS